MLKKLISLLLFLFLTQSVLASFDLHHGLAIVNDRASIDIIEHYVDAHGYDYKLVHKCQNPVNTQDISDINTSLPDGSGFHHHECHGHTSTISFSSHLLCNVTFAPVYTHFAYLLSDYSITLNLSKKPPIV